MVREQQTKKEIKPVADSHRATVVLMQPAVPGFAVFSPIPVLA